MDWQILRYSPLFQMHLNYIFGNFFETHELVRSDFVRSVPLGKNLVSVPLVGVNSVNPYDEFPKPLAAVESKTLFSSSACFLMREISFVNDLNGCLL